MKIFISGSISINNLSYKVKEFLKRVQENNFEVLVGDAKGVDSLVQIFFKDYDKVTVYTAESKPRNLVSNNFKIKVIKNDKKGREKHTQKDIAMTMDSDFSFVIWDGKSKGSYANILRAIENEKEIKVYLSSIDKFITPTKENIEKTFRINNGYSGKELLENFQFLQSYFKSVRSLNRFLIENNIFEENKEFFIKEIKRGREVIRYKDSLIPFLEEKLKQATLF